MVLGAHIDQHIGSASLNAHPFGTHYHIGLLVVRDVNNRIVPCRSELPYEPAAKHQVVLTLAELGEGFEELLLHPVLVAHKQFRTDPTEL